MISNIRRKFTLNITLKKGWKVQVKKQISTAWISSSLTQLTPWGLPRIQTRCRTIVPQFLKPQINQSNDQHTCHHQTLSESTMKAWVLLLWLWKPLTDTGTPPVEYLDLTNWTAKPVFGSIIQSLPKPLKIVPTTSVMLRKHPWTLITSGRLRFVSGGFLTCQ